MNTFQFNRLLPRYNAPKIATISATFARPADTNAYAALDTVANSTSAPVAMQFNASSLYAGGGGYITKAILATDQITNTARFRLHLFNAAPTPINDNSPYLTLFANINNRIGTIDFPAAFTEDPSNSTQATSTVTPGIGNCPLAFSFISSAAILYGLLETLDAFTPASAENFTINLTVDEN